MATVFVFRNIRFVIYPNDHKPPHVHAISPNGEAKIELANLECYFSRGYSERDLRRILEFVTKKRTQLMEVWNEIHG